MMNSAEYGRTLLMKRKNCLAYGWIVAFFAILTTCLQTAATQVGSSQCKAADSISTRVNGSISDLLLSTDSGDVAMRDTVGINGVQPSQVALVTDGRICSRLASELDHLAGVNNSGRVIYAFSVGKTFAALDPAIRAGEWVQLIFYDNHYKFLWSVSAF
jgi:hypothetical protein